MIHAKTPLTGQPACVIHVRTPLTGQPACVLHVKTPLTGQPACVIHVKTSSDFRTQVRISDFRQSERPGIPRKSDSCQTPFPDCQVLTSFRDTVSQIHVKTSLTGFKQSGSSHTLRIAAGFSHPGRFSGRPVSAGFNVSNQSQPDQAVRKLCVSRPAPCVDPRCA